MGGTPHRVGFYFTPGHASDVYVSGNYAYVADWDRGLRVIDVSNPSNPQEVGYYDTPGYAHGVYVSGNYVYVADYSAGLRVIDVSNPSNPQEVGYYDTPGRAGDVYVSGNYAYVADGESGLQIYEFYGTGVEEDVGDVGHVNLRFMTPFKFDVEFIIPDDERVWLELFDISGRRLWETEFRGGIHRISKKLPSGVYFLRIDTRNKIN